MRGGWRTDFARGSFRGTDYDELAASLAMRPECARLLDRAAASGRLHGDAADDFPLETALHSVRLLLGERPCGTLVVAREQITRLVPVPATLDYAIAVTRSDDGLSVTYTVALPGTTFGNTPVQFLTDLNPLCSAFDLTVDGRAYTHNFWAGFYASVAAGAEPPVVQILKKLAAAVGAVKEGGEVEHRLVLTGYSLGATQVMLLMMLYCDDAMQRVAGELGVGRATFASVTVLPFAMPNAVRSGETCAYVRNAAKRLNIGLYAVCDPLDLVEHFYGALPLMRAIVPHVYVLEESGVYRVDAASVTHGAMYGVAWRLSWAPWDWLATLGTVARMVSVVTSTHMLVEYMRKLHAVKGASCALAA